MSEIIDQKVRELGRFVRFGTPIAIEAARKMIRFLPEAREEELVEFPNEDVPSLEALDERCAWY